MSLHSPKGQLASSGCFSVPEHSATTCNSTCSSRSPHSLPPCERSASSLSSGSNSRQSSLNKYKPLPVPSSMRSLHSPACSIPENEVVENYHSPCSFHSPGGPSSSNSCLHSPGVSSGYAASPGHNVFSPRGHPNEAVVKEANKLSNDKPIEQNEDVLIPDDMVNYLNWVAENNKHQVSPSGRSSATTTLTSQPPSQSRNSNQSAIGHPSTAKYRAYQQHLRAKAQGNEHQPSSCIYASGEPNNNNLPHQPESRQWQPCANCRQNYSAEESSFCINCSAHTNRPPPAPSHPSTRQPLPPIYSARQNPHANRLFNSARAQVSAPLTHSPHHPAVQPQHGSAPQRVPLQSCAYQGYVNGRPVSNQSQYNGQVQQGEYNYVQHESYPHTQRPFNHQYAPSSGSSESSCYQRAPCGNNMQQYGSSVHTCHCVNQNVQCVPGQGCSQQPSYHPAPYAQHSGRSPPPHYSQQPCMENNTLQGREMYQQFRRTNTSAPYQQQQLQQMQSHPSNSHQVSQVSSTTDFTDHTSYDSTSYDDFSSIVSSDSVSMYRPLQGAGIAPELQNSYGNLYPGSKGNAPILESSNMVVNDMQSVLSQLEEENQYLSMLP